MFDTALHRWVEAATNAPSLSAWLQASLWLVGYGAVAIPLGWWTGLLTWEPVTHWRTALSAGAIAFWVPAVLEESIFRVLLLPQPETELSTPELMGWLTLSLGLFVVAHPLNGLLYLKAARPTFFNPIFLTCAGLLGIACTATYWQSQSLWVPVLLHWIVVLVWLLGLGGLRRTSEPMA